MPQVTDPTQQGTMKGRESRPIPIEAQNDGGMVSTRRTVSGQQPGRCGCDPQGGMGNQALERAGSGW